MCPRHPLAPLAAAAATPVARMLPIGPGGPHGGFSTPRYVRITKGLSQNKIGSADSPPPAPPPGAPPGPGPRSWIPWCGARKGCLARAIVPSGGPCHPPARPHSSGLALLSLPLSSSSATKFSRPSAQHPFWVGLRRRRQKAEKADRGLLPPSWGGGGDLDLSPR
jgi:hypothetical protein